MKYEDQLKEIARMKTSFDTHALEEVNTTRSFRMARGAENNMSCQITFSSTGITITGDITPERNGSTSCRGYDINWFAGELSPHYLADKFLTEKWQASVAAYSLKDPECYERENIAEREGDQTATLEQLDDLIKELTHGCMNQHEFWERYEALGLECYDGIPGVAYDMGELGWLCAIQQRFAELYTVHRIDGTTTGRISMKEPHTTGLSDDR